jgi:hypothetical protein
LLIENSYFRFKRIKTGLNLANSHQIQDLLLQDQKIDQ